MRDFWTERTFLELIINKKKSKFERKKQKLRTNEKRKRSIFQRWQKCRCPFFSFFIRSFLCIFQISVGMNPDQVQHERDRNMKDRGNNSCGKLTQLRQITKVHKVTLQIATQVGIVCFILSFELSIIPKRKHRVQKQTLSRIFPKLCSRKSELVLQNDRHPFILQQSLFL